MADFLTNEAQLQELEQEITRKCLELGALDDFESPISYWQQTLALAEKQEYLYKLRIAMLSAQTVGFYNTTKGKLMLGDLENVTKNKEGLDQQLRLLKEQMEKDGQLCGAALESQNYMKFMAGPTPDQDEDKSEGETEYYDAVSQQSNQEDMEILDSASQASEKWEGEDFNEVSDSEGSFSWSSASSSWECEGFYSEHSDSNDNDTGSSVSNPWEDDDFDFGDSDSESDTNSSASGYETCSNEEFDNNDDNASEWESSTEEYDNDNDDNASKWETSSSISSDSEADWSTQACDSIVLDDGSPNSYDNNNNSSNNNNKTNATLIDLLISLPVNPKPNSPIFKKPGQQRCYNCNPVHPSTRTRPSTPEVVTPTYNIDEVLKQNMEYLLYLEKNMGWRWEQKGNLGRRQREERLILEKQLRDMEEVVVGRGGGGAWFDGRL